MSQLSYRPRPVAGRRQPAARRQDLAQIDQALWAAYRKYDRSAVMEQLLRCCLGLRRSRAR